MTNEELLNGAIKNNAELCELVCSSNGTTGVYRNGYWVSAHTVADYYPNFITIDPDVNIDLFQKEIADFNPKRAWTVKDSYSKFNLKPLGFKTLFTASWVKAPEKFSASEPTQAEWKVVESEEELLAWEKSWSGRWEPKQKTLFKPALLQNPEIKFIAANLDGEIVAGVIANLSRSVVGYSNLFVHRKSPQSYWVEAIEFIRKQYKSLPVVGYERDEDLKTALALGFKPLGDLMVWLKK